MASSLLPGGSIRDSTASTRRKQSRTRGVGGADQFVATIQKALSVDQEDAAVVVRETTSGREEIRLAVRGTGFAIDFLRRGPDKEAERAGLGEIEERIPAGGAKRFRSVGTGQKIRQWDSKDMKG